MSQFWKTLLAPVLAAIVAGYFLKSIQDPPTAAIVAEASWSVTPNPFANADLKVVFGGAFDPKKEPTLASQIDDAIGQYISIKITNLKLKNNSDLVAKLAEVSLPDGGILFYFSSDKTMHLTTKWAAQTLAPGAEVNFTILSRPGFLWQSEPYLVTHDGRKITPMLATVPQEMLWLSDFASRYPPLVYPAAMFLAFLAVLFVLAISFGLWGESSIERKAKMTSAKEAKKLRKLVDYISANQPEKLN